MRFILQCGVLIMSELKITKGDWSIVDSTDQSLSIWASESECITTINYAFWDEKYKDELKANAHLIAAAPDMYEMLDLLVKQDVINDVSLEKEVIQLLSRARGES